MDSVNHEIRAVFYGRVSTTKQTEASVGEQLRRCVEYAKNKGWTVGKDYYDMSTGMNTNRPGFQELMEDIGDWDIVIAYKLDRFHRSSRNITEWAESLDKNGRNFVAMDINIDTSNAVGRMIFGMLALMNQMEVELTRERTSMGLEAVKNEGRWVGKPPYGYDSLFKLTEEKSDKGILQKNAEEAATVKLVYALRTVTNRADRPMPLSTIAEILTTLSIPTRTGKVRWSNAIIKNILNKSDLYCGNYHDSEMTLMKYNWEAIFDNLPTSDDIPEDSDAIKLALEYSDSGKTTKESASEIGGSGFNFGEEE
jgi:site-specific DNA recombinase